LKNWFVVVLRISEYESQGNCITLQRFLLLLRALQAPRSSRETEEIWQDWPVLTVVPVYMEILD